jgi:hypothetical protein
MTIEEFTELSFTNTETHDIILKWDCLGFLGNSLNKRNVALGFELVTKFLVGNIEEYDGYAEPILPTMYRILCHYPETIPLGYLKAFILELLEDFPIESYLGDHEFGKYNIDYQAILIAEYADNYPKFKL